MTFLSLLVWSIKEPPQVLSIAHPELCPLYWQLREPAAQVKLHPNTNWNQGWVLGLVVLGSGVYRVWLESWDAGLGELINVFLTIVTPPDGRPEVKQHINLRTCPPCLTFGISLTELSLLPCL